MHGGGDQSGGARLRWLCWPFGSSVQRYLLNRRTDEPNGQHRPLDGHEGERVERRRRRRRGDAVRHVIGQRERPREEAAARDAQRLARTARLLADGPPFNRARDTVRHPRRHGDPFPSTLRDRGDVSTLCLILLQEASEAQQRAASTLIILLTILTVAVRTQRGHPGVHRLAPHFSGRAHGHRGRDRRG